MKSLWNDLTNWWKSATSGLSKTFSGTLKISSPSKLFMEHGADIVRGLAIGLERNMPSAFGVMDALATGMTASMDGNYTYNGAEGGDNGEAALLVENNNLLRILIAELRNKDLSVNIAGGGGTDYGGMVAFKAEGR